MEGIESCICQTSTAQQNNSDLVDFNLEVFVEIAKGSHVKYEYDKKKTGSCV